MEQKLDVRGLDVREVRVRIWDNEYAGPTGGLTAVFAQANLVVLSGEYGSTS